MLRARDLVSTLAGHGRFFRFELPKLDMAPGEICVVSGPSGSGKTLLLETLGLLLRPDSGECRIRDPRFGEIEIRALWDGPAKELSLSRGRIFGFVPQTGGLVPFLTARENAALSQEAAERRDADFLEFLIERLELSDVADSRPGQMSIGQRQRVSIARALAHRPALVIADEPTSALDTGLRKIVYAALLDLANETETSVVMSSHDAEAAALRGVRRFAIESMSVEGGAVSYLRETSE